MTCSAVAIRVSQKFGWKSLLKALAFTCLYSVIGLVCTFAMLLQTGALRDLRNFQDPQMVHVPFWQTSYAFVGIVSSAITAGLFGRAILKAKAIENLWLAVGAGFVNVIPFALIAVPQYAMFAPIMCLKAAWLFFPLCLICHFLMKVVGRSIYRKEMLSA